MRLKLITPEKIILDEKVDSVTLPAYFGEMTILPGHAMLVTQLVPGSMHFKKIDNEGKEQTTKYKIDKGFCEVEKDNVAVLTGRVSQQGL